MFQQLSNLSLEAEGRYAQPEELEFVEDYLLSAEVRISAYQKIRDKENEILEKISSQMQEIDPHIFSINDCDFTSVCLRDTKLVIRCSAIAMLLNDLNRLREGLLLWQKTIINAIDHQHHTKIAHQIIPQAIEQFLTPEEFKLMMPFLALNQTILVY